MSICSLYAINSAWNLTSISNCWCILDETCAIALDCNPMQSNRMEWYNWLSVVGASSTSTDGIGSHFMLCHHHVLSFLFFFCHYLSLCALFLFRLFAAPKDKFNFNVRLNLISSQPFVQCGQFLDLCYSTRSLAVKVDPTGLPPGVHTAV